MQTQLAKMLGSGNYEEASSLLCDQLKSASIINPSDPKTWGNLADQIWRKIRDNKGNDEAVLFWEEMLAFFQNEIEPIWGEVHKGHIYFRLGFCSAYKDGEKTITYFELAQEEERRTQAAIHPNQPTKVKSQCKLLSSYVALSILKRIKIWDKLQGKGRQFFITNFLDAFDAAISDSTKPKQEVHAAIRKLVKNNRTTYNLAKELYEELLQVSKLKQNHSTLFTTGAILEIVLYGHLKHQHRINALRDKKKIEDATLGQLISLSKEISIFPNDSIQATIELIAHLRNRIHAGNTLETKYPLTPQAAMTLKILMENTICEWASSERKDYPPIIELPAVTHTTVAR